MEKSRVNYGKVKWFDEKKGYGFIITPTLEEYFFHFTGILMKGFKKLDAGDSVTFDLISGRDNKGMIAVNVSLVKD